MVSYARNVLRWYLYLYGIILPQKQLESGNLKGMVNFEKRGELLPKNMKPQTKKQRQGYDSNGHGFTLFCWISLVVYMGQAKVSINIII